MDESLKCDFCGASDVKFEYGAEDHVIGIAMTPDKIETTVSQGEWIACPVCAELIEAGDEKALRERAVERHPDLTERNRGLLLILVTNIHAGFWSYRTGKRREIIWSC